MTGCCLENHTNGMRIANDTAETLSTGVFSGRVSLRLICATLAWTGSESSPPSITPRFAASFAGSLWRNSQTTPTTDVPPIKPRRQPSSPRTETFHSSAIGAERSGSRYTAACLVFRVDVDAASATAKRYRRIRHTHNLFVGSLAPVWITYAHPEASERYVRTAGLLREAERTAGLESLHRGRLLAPRVHSAPGVALTTAFHADGKPVCDAVDYDCTGRLAAAGETKTPTATIGGKPVVVTYAARISSGLNQINATVPGGCPTAGRR